MFKIVNYLSHFVNQCTGCKNGRKGQCAWMQQYQDAASRQSFEGVGSYETRALLTYAAAGEPCDDQLSFDELIAGVDVHLTSALAPATYQELVSFLSALGRLNARSNRFSKPLLPLLKDFLGAGCEHCLAHIDYTYLGWGIDIEALLLSFFPDYHRLEVLGNCNYPPSLISRAVRHATRLSIDEMEILGGLMPRHSEDLGIGISMSSIPGPATEAPAPASLLTEKQLKIVTPYLDALVKHHYCREDYTWINTKHENGHAYTQALWIIQRLVDMHEELVEYKIGLMMGIKHIGSYSSRIPPEVPFKGPILELFEKENLEF